MLAQFLSTTIEIDSMLADKNLPELYKIKLRKFVGQSFSDENVVERNIALEEVNNQLAKDALYASDPEKLFAGNLHLSRIPSSLFEFILNHQVTLRTIILSRNHLQTVPLLLFKQLKLEKLDISNNLLDQNMIDQTKTLSYECVIADPQKISVTAQQANAKVYTPQLDSKSSVQQGLAQQSQKQTNSASSNVPKQPTGACLLL